MGTNHCGWLVSRRMAVAVAHAWLSLVSGRVGCATAELPLNLSLYNCKYSYDRICQSAVEPLRCAVLVDGVDDCEQSNDSGDDVPVIARKGIVDVKSHAGAMTMSHVHIHVHFNRLYLQWRQGQMDGFRLQAG